MRKLAPARVSCQDDFLISYRVYTREDKGDREGIPHTHPIPYVIRLELFLRPQSRGGLDNSQSHSANVFRVDDPRSEPSVLHELTLKKNSGRRDAESDLSIRFVDEND